MNDRDKNRRTKFLVGAVAALTLATHSTFATNGSWNADSDGNWSDATKWLGGNIADGAGATANFTFNITGSRTITLDSARTVGIVNIGDTDGSDIYFFGAASGVSLTLDNGPSNAQINQTSTSSVTPFNVPLILNGSLDVINSSGQALGLQGNISAGTAGTKTITVSGGPVEMLGATSDGSGVIAIVYNASSVLLSNSSDNNTYSGGTTINGGTVSIGSSGSPFGSGTLTFSGGALKIQGSRSTALVNNVVITGDTVFTARTGPSNVTALFGGTLTGTGGTLTILSDATSTSGLFDVRFSGGDYTMARPIVLDNGGGAGAVRLNDVSVSGTTHTYSGLISGTGRYNRSGGGLTVFLADNTYTGTTTVTNGTLQLGNGGTTGSLSPSSVISFASSSGTLIFDHTSGSDFVQGTNFSSSAITGAGQIIKEGTSSLTFNVANTFSGGLTINKGTVVATADGALGTGGINLNAASVTLTLQGGVNPNFIADTATLTIGFNTDTVNLNYTGTEVVGGLIIEGSPVAPGTYGAGGDFPELMGTGTITVVPEPTTLAMMALGASMLVGVQRFRRKLR